MILKFLIIWRYISFNDTIRYFFLERFLKQLLIHQGIFSRDIHQGPIFERFSPGTAFMQPATSPEKIDNRHEIDIFNDSSPFLSQYLALRMPIISIWILFGFGSRFRWHFARDPNWMKLIYILIEILILQGF